MIRLLSYYMYGIVYFLEEFYTTTSSNELPKIMHICVNTSCVTYTSNLVYVDDSLLAVTARIAALLCSPSLTYQ